MARAWLSLGSNIDAPANLQAALDELRTRFGEILESPWYRTQAVGFQGPDFINLAVRIDTDLEPVALGNWLRALEGRRGRDRTQPRFASRTLDIDLVLYEDGGSSGKGREIPSSDLAHAFVLRPLCDLDPAIVPPDGDPRTLNERWQALSAHARARIEAIQPERSG